MQHIDIYINLVIDNVDAKRKRPCKNKATKKKTTDPGDNKVPDARRQQNDEHRNNDPRTR